MSPSPAATDDAVRAVPLGSAGGPRHRHSVTHQPERPLVPRRERRVVGPWCWVSPMGPLNGLAPHPHTGTELLSWLVSGQVRHLDSVGTPHLAVPGELTLLTAGAGVSHAETAVEGRAPRGVRLWAALPPDCRDMAPRVQRHADLPAHSQDGATLTVIIGEMVGLVSPAHTQSPAVLAQLDLAPGSVIALRVNADWEHGVVLLERPAPDDGTHGQDVEVTVADAPVLPDELAFVPEGQYTLTFSNQGAAVSLLILGGPGWTHPAAVWETLVGQSRDDLAAAQQDWQRGLTRRAAGADPAARFGRVDGYDGAPRRLAEVPKFTLRSYPAGPFASRSTKRSEDG